MVTTSGGGFALMSEAVSLSGAIETPLVVHIGQRPGPATGLPTRTEQGDLNLAIHAGHGDFLKVVLAPGDLEEGFALSRLAFDIADRYQSPVFILTDQYYVDSYYTTEPFTIEDSAPESRIVETAPDYRRYILGSPEGISPRGIPGRGAGIVCVDSDEHDEGGYITEDSAMRAAMVAKRLAKIAAAQKASIPPTLYGDRDYSTLLVGWGSVKMPIIEAMAALKKPGLAYLHFPGFIPCRRAFASIWPPLRSASPLKATRRGNSPTLSNRKRANVSIIVFSRATASSLPSKNSRKGFPHCYKTEDGHD